MKQHVNKSDLSHCVVTDVSEQFSARCMAIATVTSTKRLPINSIFIYTNEICLSINKFCLSSLTAFFFTSTETIINRLKPLHSW